jgi:hypothetical protein
MSQANDSPNTTLAPATTPAAPSLYRCEVCGCEISADETPCEGLEYGYKCGISLLQVGGPSPRRTRTPLAVPAVQAAHITLVAALASLKPHRIIGSYAADRFDILERAEHLEKVLAAVTVYTKAIVADTAYLAPIGYVADETGFLKDAASDIVGALKNAVDKMIDDAAQAAE